MKDQKTTIQDLKDQFRKFVKDRDWEKFHTAKNLSMGISVEASELMEHFIWASSEESSQIFEKNRQEIENEVSDIAILLFQFCNMYNIDLTSATEHKLKELEERYTIEKSYGKWTKIKKAQI